MGKKGQSSDPVTFRVPSGVLERIDREVEEFRQQSTRTEFLLDAVKFYLNYLEDKRIDEWRMQSEPASATPAVRQKSAGGQ